MSCRKRLARAGVGAWEEYQPALSGIIALYMESFETEDLLKLLLKFYPLKIVRSVFIFFWSNSHAFMFKLTKTKVLAFVLKCEIHSLFPVCPSFLLTDSCACWSFCFSSVWIYELPYSPLQLMTRPARINEVTAGAKKRKQQTVKWMKQKWFPSRKSFYDQLLTEELLYTTIARDRPYTNLKILTIRDIRVTKMATHLLLQIRHDLCHQVTFPYLALWKQRG